MQKLIYRRRQDEMETNKIKLEDILKKDEEHTTIPTETKERLLSNILKQLIKWMNQKNKQ